MDNKKNILTYAGLKKLEDELEHLKVVKRKEVSQKIKEAREQGDLSENAEYDAAKDEQRDIEARIEEIEKILMFVGAVADNFDERIEQKIFHAEIVIDREKLAGETASYVPIPEISSFRDADGVDRMEEIIRRNYTQIKEDVTQIIKRELRRIAEDPALRHLLAKK